MNEASPFDLQALGAAAAGPRAILRVLHVLGHLSDHPEGCTLAQLCDALRLPKTTLFTMLRTLQAAGHLHAAAGVWRLGPEAIALGARMAASARHAFPACAMEALEGLCRRTGETGILAVLTADGMNCRYVAVVESESWLRFSVERESTRPSYATGTGHAMLAWLAPGELRAILARVRFDRITDKTVASKRALAAALAKVRADRVSTTDSGTVAGVLSVAAPIFDASGRVMAAISAGGPAARMTPQLATIQRAVRGAAEDVSRTLGLVGDWPAVPAQVAGP
ncbi:IclR family transcriptional regulator [Ramlibacter sp.]|uniref:IclR family transcriptional regulator n=1 Tax=Ramlibacter sp. TaxID=1917967 RepID=UPI003D1026DA